MSNVGRVSLLQERERAQEDVHNVESLESQNVDTYTPPHLSQRIPLASAVIVLVEFFERFSFYSLTLSKGTFMTQRLNFTAARSAQINGCFGTSVYAMSWLGGAIADTRLGRFWTIGIFAGLYSVGIAVAAIAAAPSVNSETLFFAGVFGLLPIASGGIKPVVSVFGADQIVNTTDNKLNKKRFYSIFYGALMLAAALASIIMPNIATEVWPGIRKGWGYFDAYITAASCMLFATVLFFIASPMYVREDNNLQAQQQQPSVALHFVKAIAKSGCRSFRGAVALFGWLLTIPFFWTSYQQAIDDDQNLAYVAFGIYFVQFGCLIWAHLDNSFISHDRAGVGPVSAAQIRQSFQCLPAVLAVSATFTFIWRITQNYFAHQTCQMDLRMGGTEQQLNGVSINVTNNFSVILAILILEAVIYPYFERKHMKVSMLSKCMLGILMAALSGAVALVLELVRADAAVLAPGGWSSDAPMAKRFPDIDPSNFPTVTSYMGQCVVDGRDYCSNCAPKRAVGGIDVGIYMSETSAFWMAVPFILTGIGEALVMPVLQHYAYSSTPKMARAFVQALVLVFSGMYPLSLVTVFTTILKDHLKNNLNIKSDDVTGVSLGIEVFYYVGLIFALLGVPFAYFVLLKAKTGNSPDDAEDPLVRIPPADNGTGALSSSSGPAYRNVER